MRLCLLLCLCCVSIGNGYVGSRSPNTSSITYKTKQRDVVLQIMVHIDIPASKALARQYKVNSRRKLKSIVKGVLENARTLLSHTSLNQPIRFKLLCIEFLKHNKMLIANEDASKYLASYCDWQSRRKLKSVHYSVLFTGVDLYYMNKADKFRRSTGRSYQNGVCSFRKSCAILEWDKRNMAYLLAHEIGHSLGINHDGFQNHCDDQKYIMAAKYDQANHPKTWSSCSRQYIKQFLQNRRSWCIK